MKIKTQFIACVSIFIIVLIIIAISIAKTDQDVNRLRTQEMISSKVERVTSSLNRVAINYFLYQEDIHLSRWQSFHSSLHDDLLNLNVSDPQQQMLVKVIDEDLHELNQSFSQVVSFLQGASRNVSVRIDLRFQALWESVGIKSEELAADASQLSHSINDQVRQVSMTNTLLIGSLLVSSSAFLVTMFLIVFLKTLRSVTDLKRGINTIGSGNLDHIIETKRGDEISELSDSFNKMTTRLKTVIASKAELEKEISQRKKTEEALIKTEKLAHDRNIELEKLQYKLEEKAAEVEEYANQMECLAQERLNRLKDTERLAAIGATAGMVGHDIRNPLQAISGDIYFARKDLIKMPNSPLKQGIMKNLDEIESEIDYINKIVQDLQDYARPVKITLQETNLDQLCSDIMSTINVPSNTAIAYHINHNAQKLLTDPTVLKRILTNLVSNAVQAMPNGGKVEIEASKEDMEFIISVSDNGVGISEEVRPKLFTPLMTTKSKGQGFGLAVVKRMTEALGGTVSFESKVGEGTKFILSLPYKS